jgi:hypothetical protein
MPFGRSLTPLVSPICPACRGTSGAMASVNSTSPIGHRARPPLLAAWLTGWLVAVASDGIADRPAGADESSARVAIALRDGADVIGRIVVEAQDGGMLVEHDDGRYEIIQPDRLAGGPPQRAPAGEPDTPQALGRRILAELPAGFDLLVTKHYVVCFDTSRDYAKWCAALFERLHDAFGTYWARAGLAVHDPPRPLVVVIFADRHGYEAHAAATLGAAAGRVVGYYDMLSNRVTTYDLTGSDILTNGRPRAAGAAGLAILSSPAATGLVSTLVHEATHQLAFNGGLHRRLAPVPLWVSEGLATYFETPDLRNARGWKGIGEVNRPRLDHFLKTCRPGVIEAIVRDDEPFRHADTALDAYAAAWALSHHLLQTRKPEFVAYLHSLAVKQPLAEDSPEARLREFQEAFGDPTAVEQRVIKAAARLAPGLR